MDRAVDIFAAVIRTAPYGKYTARAQFDIGLAREKQGANDAALQAYQAVIDKFPNDPVAALAQYQIGYIWFMASKSGTKDIAATNNARTAFQDYLFRYPNSEKAQQVRANLQQLENKSITRAYDVARFYDKQRAYRAAVIYYNEVIRQQPGSAESEKAKKRIEELRAKFGDKALQSALEPGQENKTKDQEKGKAAASAEKPPAENPPALDAAPVLPSDLDTALPPPPATSSGSSSSSSEPATSATPEPTTAPDQTPVPTPEETPSVSLPLDSGASDATASPTP
jgi:outer membrane protein assembly factor BamD